MNTRQQPLRCLLVEDNEDDALLVLRELRSGGYDVVSERVETAEAMRAALERQPWDAIIADYRMPHFSGLAALELLQASGLDVPFIIVSGAIGEEVAVTAMKAGAHDYLMKGRLARLVPALERELREAIERREHRQAETELDQYRHHLEQLVFARTAELAHSRDAAEAANRAKSIFVATMSHELLTPMNGIMGMINLALSRATDAKQIEWLKMGKGSAQRLLAIINDILDFSSMEAEQLTLEENDFSLAQVMDDALRVQGAAARTKGLSLSGTIDPALPDLLRGDALRLRQILGHFIGNAIKFSEHGQIALRASVVEEDRHSVLLRIEVTDQGIGIRHEDQTRLFQIFTQADDSSTRKQGGTGLGLPICKRLALLMGGEVGADSTPGVGSTFWFTARLGRLK